MTTILAPPTADGQRVCPFVGLSPYGPEDTEWFFGREADSALLADNLIAYEFTLVYGPSGVGKTSLINAGVVDEMHRQAALEAERGRAPFVTVVHRDWQLDPIADLNASILAAVRRQRPDLRELPPPTLSFADSLQSWTRLLGAQLYIVLDQFEEYFLYHEDPGDPTTTALADAIATVDDGTNFMVVMREDTLAELDRFEGLVPDLFENYYRVEHLDRAAAATAIRSAIQQYNHRYAPQPPVTIEDELVDEVLETVATGNVRPTGTGVGKPATERRDAIETAQLQLVLARLWASEIARGGAVLRGGTLARLGGAEGVIRNHLADAMARLDRADQRMMVTAFQHLVTPSGSKVALALDDLADYAGVAPAELGPVLERLSEGDVRVLRPVAPTLDQPDVPRYEIFHDVLAGPILEWTTAAREAQQLAETEDELARTRARARRERRRGVVAMVAALAMVVLAGVAFVLWQRSEDQRAENESQGMAAEALNLLRADPAAAAELAADAWQRSPTAEAERALRTVLPDLRVELVLAGHTDAVLDARFLPDGERAVTISADGTARIWDTTTGDELEVLEGHVGFIGGLDIAPDGELLVTRDEKAVRVWDARTGRPVSTFEPERVISDARFGPDGEVVLVSGPGSVVEVVDVESGVPVTVLEHEEAGGVEAIAVSVGDGRPLVATGDWGGSVRVWDARTWEQLDETVVIGAVRSLEFAPAGDVLAISAYIQSFEGVTYGQNPWVWEWGVGAEPSDDVSASQVELGQGDLALHTDAPLLAFAPDGERLVTGGDRTFQIWDRAEWEDALFTAEPEHVLRGHVDWVTDAAWTHDGTAVATAGADGRIFVRDGETGGFVADLRGHEGSVNGIDFGVDGRLMSASDDRTARLWRLPPATVFRGHDSWVIDVDLSAEAGVLVSAGADGTVRGHDPGDGTEIWTLLDEDRERLEFVGAVDISADGRTIVAGGSSGRVIAWSVADGVPTELDSWSPDGFVPVLDLELSPDGSTVAATTFSGVHLLTLGDDEPAPLLVGHTGAPFVAYSPDGDQLATGGLDGTIRIWDPDSGAELVSIEAHRGGVQDVEYSADGDLIVSGGADRLLRLWDARTYEPVGTLSGHDYPVTSVAFSADGDWAASGDEGGFVAVWDVEDRTLLALQRKHEVYVNDVNFDAERRIITAGDDNVARSYGCWTCGPIDSLLSELDARLPRLGDAAVARPLAFVVSTRVPAGTCTASPADPDEFTLLDVVDCAEPHVLEHVASFRLDASDDEVGGSAGDLAGEPDVLPPYVEDLANDVCTGAAERYVGGSLPSELVVQHSVPTGEAWASGSRAITCAIRAADGSELTRSYRASD